MPGAHTVLGGTDVARFRPPGEPTERREGVFVGRILPHTGLNYLIEAMDPDVPLAIVGRRSRHSASDRLLAGLAEGKRIRFIEGQALESGEWAPPAEDPAIVATLQNALCVVLPSVRRTVFGPSIGVPELLGLVVLEGMACGAPAIVTDVSSLPEVVVDGETGFVVPPNGPGALRAKIPLAVGASR